MQKGQPVKTGYTVCVYDNTVMFHALHLWFKKIDIFPKLCEKNAFNIFIA